MQTKCKCRHCKIKFIQKRFNVPFCMQTDDCITAFLSYAKEVKAKQQRVKDKKTREGLKSNSDYLKELQKEINTIVRLIDKGSQCISSLKPLNDKFDAGHLYSVGSNPALRFHLDNIHAQSVYANQYLSGDQINYINGLSHVYGENYKDYVLNLKSVYKTLKLSQNELKEKISIARQIVKELKSLDLQYPSKVRIELRKKYNERLGMYT